MKTINRKAFQERLIHRYLLEGFYQRHPEIIKLLPVELRKRKINAVIPEAGESTTRPDLKIYFKDHQDPHFIEVKWSPTSNINKLQLQFLRKRSGSLLYLKGDFSEVATGIHQAQINGEDVQRWLRASASRLWQDTLAEHGEIEHPKKWMMLLRGSFKHHWSKMKSVSPGKKGFWAFQNQRTIFNSIFNIGRSDILYIIDAKITGAQQSVPKNIQKVTGIDLTAHKMKILEPHYFDESSQRGSIFETSENTPIYDRKYVHFISFELLESGSSKQLRGSAMRQDLRSLWDKIVWSANHVSGSPIELTTTETFIVESLMSN